MTAQRPFRESPMIKIVIGLLGSAGIAFVFWRFPLAVAVGLTLLFVVEMWALLNRYKGDTISEVIWWLSSRPMVPFVFGVATGALIAAGILVDPWAVGLTLFLEGHFFFQAQGRDKERRGDRQGAPPSRPPLRHYGKGAAVVLLALFPFLTGCGPTLRFLSAWADEMAKPTPTPEVVATPTPMPEEPEPAETPEPEPQLGAPSNLVAETGFEKVDLKWDAGENAAGYQVTRSGAVQREVVGTSYTWAPLPNGSRHTFVVRSIGFDGVLSARSNIVDVTIPEPEPEYEMPVGVKLKMTSLYCRYWKKKGHPSSGCSGIVTAVPIDAAGQEIDTGDRWHKIGVDPDSDFTQRWTYGLTTGHWVKAEGNGSGRPTMTRSHPKATRQIDSNHSQYDPNRGWALHWATKETAVRPADRKIQLCVDFDAPAYNVKDQTCYDFYVLTEEEMADPANKVRKWPIQQ